MTNCTKKVAKFLPLKRREIEAEFCGGAITSDGGALLLRQVDKKIKLTQAAARFFNDPRDSSKTVHSTLSMIRQRVFGIALGYEDLNDHDDLRKDSLLQATVESDRDLASSATLCRFENRANRQAAVELNKLLVESFISSISDSPPKELIFDFDATDIPIYGNQEKKAYHGYYNSHCFLPLHVFCGDNLLLSYLRPCNQDPAKHAWAILSLLVKRVRQKWPDIKIIFRADSGFCRHKILQWCDKNKVDYIVGIGANNRLKKELEPTANKAKKNFEESGAKQKLFAAFEYGAKTWGTTRRIIGKAEHTAKGSNQRFVVTSFSKSGKELYEKLYCARGDAENRIKEQMLLFSGRTSCHKWWPNQLRMLFSALAYVLMETLRRVGLKGTKYARCQVDTLRLKFFKIGGVILKNTRRIKVCLSEYYPNKDHYFTLVKNLQIV